MQEVIVQNFLPKAGHGHAPADPCLTPDEFLWTIAVARVILPPDVHVQAPPNLSDDFGELLAAGIDDWGGVSPVTADHVNPERPWPALDRLRAVTEAAGFTLAPRLTIYPEFALDAGHAGSTRPCASRCSTAATPRAWPASPVDDRGTRDADVDAAAAHPAGPAGPAGRRAGGAVGRGPGRRAPRPGAGRGRAADPLLGPRPRGGGRRRGGRRAAGRHRRRHRHLGRNRNINYTNVCTFKCRFCAFSKGPLSLNLRGTPYLLEVDEITRRVVEAEALGRHRGLPAGRDPPELRRRLLHRRRSRRSGRASPTIHIHGFTALEVTEGARRLE